MFMTLFGSKHGFLMTDQRVFAADELKPLLSAVDQARQLSERLEQQASAEEEARSRAQRLGRKEGLIAGKNDATVQLTKTVKQLHEDHNKALLDLQAGAADLAVNIVRKIAGQVASPEWLIAQARSAAEELGEQSAMKLRVHPSKVEAVKAQLQNLPVSQIKQVVVDDFLPVNGCALETPQGQVDVDLDTQLSNILALFQDDVCTLSKAVDLGNIENLHD